MVQYLPSSATAQINVITSEVGTVLTLTAPAEVIQGQPIRLSGELRRSDNNTLLSGETITAVFNGTTFGSDTTMNGTYNIDGVINDIGTYTLTVNFAGSTRPGLVLSPSQIIRRIGIGMEAITPPMMVVASAAILGAILVRVGLSK